MSWRVKQSCGVCGRTYVRMNDEPDEHACADVVDRAELRARKTATAERATAKRRKKK